MVDLLPHTSSMYFLILEEKASLKSFRAIRKCIPEEFLTCSIY